MNNYWLDRRSDRIGSVEHCPKHQTLSNAVGSLTQIKALIFPVTYRVELRQGGQAIIPMCHADVKYRLDKLDITFIDGVSHEIPIESYEWLANVYDWGRKTGPQVDVAVKKYVGKKKVEENIHHMDLIAVKAGQIDFHNDDLPITIMFQK